MCKSDGILHNIEKSYPSKPQGRKSGESGSGLNYQSSKAPQEFEFSEGQYWNDTDQRSMGIFRR